MSYNQESIINLIESSDAEVIAIVGPTCSGKSGLAIDIAEKLATEIVNCDSRLIFKDMNIGTAKPNLIELNRAKHHLIDIRQANEEYSAAEYQKDFDTIFTNFKTREPNKKIIITGGTGLYIKTALENLNMPEVGSDQALRNNLNTKNLEELTQILNDLDSQAYQDVDMLNPIRIRRAIEIVTLGQKPLAELRSKEVEPRYKTLYIGINFNNRRKLYDLINKRVIKMINQGLVHEVEELAEQYGYDNKTLNGTIGYKEVINYLKSKQNTYNSSENDKPLDDRDKPMSLNSAIKAIQLKTRRYAKKQMTWFRQNPSIHWFYHE